MHLLYDVSRDNCTFIISNATWKLMMSSIELTQGIDHFRIDRSGRVGPIHIEEWA